MKVIHLPNSICGMPYGLSRGERKIGLESDVLNLYKSARGYPFDYQVFKRSYSKPSDIFKIASIIPNLIKEYDVFHFNYGSTLVDSQTMGIAMLDLPIYKRCGKTIAVTYSGCDARQKYPTMLRTGMSACKDPSCYGGICNGGKLDNIRKKRIAKFGKYADVIFAHNPDLMHFLPEGSIFLPYTILGWDTLEDTPYYYHDQLKILHASTDSGAKGTEHIRRVFKTLESRYNVKTQIVENVSRDELYAAMMGADIFIDQIRVGWYGSTAVESMKLGIPTLAYIRWVDTKFIPSEMRDDLKAALVNGGTQPYALLRDLSMLIEQPEILKVVSKRQKEYVNKWHDPVYVAGITKKEYEK